MHELGLTREMLWMMGGAAIGYTGFLVGVMAIMYVSKRRSSLPPPNISPRPQRQHRQFKPPPL